MPRRNELQDKVDQIEEQLRMAMGEYPDKIALDRLKFAAALARFISTQMSIEDSVAGLIDDQDSTITPLPRRA